MSPEATPPENMWMVLGVIAGFFLVVIGGRLVHIWLTEKRQVIEDPEGVRRRRRTQQLIDETRKMNRLAWELEREVEAVTEEVAAKARLERASAAHLRIFGGSVDTGRLSLAKEEDDPQGRLSLPEDPEDEECRG